MWHVADGIFAIVYYRDDADIITYITIINIRWIHCKIRMVFWQCLYCTFYFIGIWGFHFLTSLHNAGHRLWLLLRAYISRHQTSEQGTRWPFKVWSRYFYGNYVTWSPKHRASSATGDWNSWLQVVQERVEYSSDNDLRDRLFLDMLECCRHCWLSSAYRGQYVKNISISYTLWKSHISYSSSCFGHGHPSASQCGRFPAQTPRRASECLVHAISVVTRRDRLCWWTSSGQQF